jgi:hypothetical protein
MNNLNFIIMKWNVGKHASTVVSDVKVTNNNFPSPPNPIESRDEDIEHYGCYLVCESIGNSKFANYIAAAPEMLRALEVAVGDIKRAPKDFTQEEKLKLMEEAIRKAKGVKNE